MRSMLPDLRLFRIYLVGFMGSGKTTVGKRLAEIIGWNFVDLDEQIAKKERMKIEDIF